MTVQTKPHVISERLSEADRNFFLLGSSELCGTPGYLAPEILKCSMDDMHAGYGKEVDLYVWGFAGKVKKKIQITFPLLYWTCLGACVEQVGLWSDSFHLAGWLATILAPQTDADAEDDNGGSISVQLSGVG